MVEQKPRIGEYLVSKGLVTEAKLQEALAAQRRTGVRLGQILLAFGLIRRLDLYRALSELWEMPFVLLDKEPFEPKVTRKFPLNAALKHRAVVLGRDADGTLRVAVTDLPEPALETALHAHFGKTPVRYQVTTEWDIDYAVRKHYEDALLEGSVYSLYYRNADESAHAVFTRAQYVSFVAMILLVLVLLFLYPLATLIVLNLLINIFFMGNIVFKFLASMAGARTEQFRPITDEEVAALRDEDLPKYTVLVPVYREANVIGQLIHNLAALDYPRERLEVLLLIEEDDEETLAAAKAAAPPDNFQFVIVPDGQPKTKPKACNVGLYFSTGDLLVIYDAEDRPEPDQLKKCVVAFEKGGDDMVVAQCALNYYNADENFLTRMFTLEYSYWFDYMLPGLYRLRLPIPLGGTSNHFRVDRLRELGGWDPFNVTEDADLGIRAAMHGYSVGVVNSTTFEEANSQAGNFIRQRSRWIKGYMQTALVHSRHPFALLRQVGLRQSFGFALLIAGTPLCFLAAPLLWTMFGIWAITGTEAFDLFFPASALYISIANLLWGNAMAIYLNMLAVFRRKNYGLVPFALLNPFYWLLHSVAAFKALWQLFTKPFYWEKTHHGISQMHASQTTLSTLGGRHEN